MFHTFNMGTTLSSQEALDKNASEEFKLTNLDVIHIQAVLLGLHNSISELHTKQDELKRLISVQNRLFTEQNEVVKSLASAMSGKDEIMREPSEESSQTDVQLSSSPSSTGTMPQLELPPSDELSDESYDSDEQLHTAIALEGTPEKDSNGSNSRSIPVPEETHTNVEKKQVVTGGNLSSVCVDGICQVSLINSTLLQYTH